MVQYNKIHPLFIIPLLVYLIYKKHEENDSGITNIEMEIPKKVNMGNCCSVSKSSDAAYCYGGWNAENLDGPKWSTEKCDKAT